ncbi:ribonuclease HI [Halomonas alkaliantarctica]|nr:ribonuclease HI [Halomonas alkaliantarctica]
MTTNITTNIITVHTDGSCLNNGSAFARGGWAAVLDNGHDQLRISGSEQSTTNNRMELMAVIKGVSAIRREGACAHVYTDSKYVQKGCSEWLEVWKRNNWKRSNNKPVLNADLWQELDALLQKYNIEFFWVKGHNANPMNELADRLATAASHGQVVHIRTHAGNTGPVTPQFNRPGELRSVPVEEGRASA